MSALPWVRFFPSDWLAGTRGMSAAEAGVYISLIAMMYERGEPIAEDAPRLARLCGASNSQFKKALSSLVADGKIERIDGGLWNARVGKEQVYRSEKSDVGKQAAETRWRKEKEKQQGIDAGAMRRQCERNANQKPEVREGSEPNGSGADAPTATVLELPLDARTLLFREGLPLLARATGRPETALRSLVAKWLKAVGDDADRVTRAIAETVQTGRADPISWIERSLKPADPDAAIYRNVL